VWVAGAFLLPQIGRNAGLRKCRENRNCYSELQLQRFAIEAEFHHRLSFDYFGLVRSTQGSFSSAKTSFVGAKSSG
jgi:hypothetical protein